MTKMRNFFDYKGVEDYFVNKKVWRTKEELSGDEQILGDMLFSVINQAITVDFKRESKVAIFVYFAEGKKCFDLYGKRADVINLCNGGVIPYDYAYCYPFSIFDYTPDSSGTFDSIFREKIRIRLLRFLAVQGYEHCIFVFPHNTREYSLVNEEWDAIQKLTKPYLFRDMRLSGILEFLGV